MTILDNIYTSILPPLQNCSHLNILCFTIEAGMSARDNLKNRKTQCAHPCIEVRLLLSEKGPFMLLSILNSLEFVT